MLSLLARVKVRTRIVFLLALPLMVIGGVAAFLFEREREMAGEARHVAEIVGLGPALGALVHELQKERGMSAGFVGSGGARFGEKLPAQRAVTEAALAELREAVAERMGEEAPMPFLRALAEDLGRFEVLPAIRRQVDELAIDVSGMASVYTGLIRRLLDTTKSMVLIATEPSLVHAIVAHVHFLEAKELAGQERALGTVGFGRGKFEPELYNGFLRRVVSQELLLDEARFWADREMRAMLDSFRDSRPFREISRLRERALATLGDGDLGGITGEEWFAAMTRKIDAMREIENRFVSMLATRAAALAEATETEAHRFGVVALLVVAFVLVMGVLVSRSISVPLASLVAKTSRLAAGDTSVDIPEAAWRDEIGTMAKALERFREIREKNDHEERAKIARAQRLEELMRAFEEGVSRVLAALVETTAELDAAAREMARTAQATRGNASDIAGSAEQTSSSVEAMAVAVRELRSSVEEIAERAHRSSDIAGSAVEDAREARRVAAELADATRQIEDVLGLISSITEQTHMLALNATIEAARAGEVGRGFAVVAGEVKNLAGATANATEKVRSLVENVGRATSEVVEAVERIHGVLSEMNEAATSIAGATEEQNAAVQEMARNAEDAATDTARASETIAEVREAANQTDDAAGRVREAVTVVARQTDELRDCVERFLAGVRAA